jgi:hypothetical protein
MIRLMGVRFSHRGGFRRAATRRSSGARGRQQNKAIQQGAQKEQKMMEGMAKASRTSKRKCPKQGRDKK